MQVNRDANFEQAENLIMSMPTAPKIYHIVHFDRLPSIISDSYLWCDAKIAGLTSAGTTIGMNGIKDRRLNELTLDSHPNLHIGECVPFYFCPRSIMLYLLHQGNHAELSYRGGQEPIIHLEADLHQTVDWANENDARWAFSLSNAGSRYFEDRCELEQLNEIDWDAVSSRRWSGKHKEGKQAEFLIEAQFPWELVSRIGVKSKRASNQVLTSLEGSTHKPMVQILPDWYY